MKYRLLDLIQCPGCMGKLQAHAFESEDRDLGAVVEDPPCQNCNHPEFRTKDVVLGSDCGACYRQEVVNGALVCATCNRLFPVIEGIPRFVPDAFEENLVYCRNFAENLSSLGYKNSGKQDSVFDKRFGATKRNFGFQWLRYEVTDEEEDYHVFLMKTDSDRGFFERKVVLEGGCGMGRYVKIASQMGAEVVGIDLSGAVARAYQENSKSPMVHIVQGNLMEVPFRKGSFDIVYSIGVLHHTPDTREAFEQIAGLVRTGGKCAISVYGKVHPVAEFTWKMYRKILHKLPLRLVHYLCYIAVPKGFIDSWLQRYRLTRKLGAISQSLLPVSPHQKWQVRLCDTFDWYMPQYQRYHTYAEVTDWFRGCGFSEVKELRNEVWPVNVTGVK